MTSTGIARTETILDKIAARKVEEVAALKATLNGSGFTPRTDPIRDFAGALKNTEHVALIAEIKKASPSRGLLSPDFDPVRLVTTYAAHGASAVSVLTDHDFFQGSLSDLQAARSAMDLPVIRKDFMIDPVQIHEAHSAGADAILLIVSMLENSLLRDLYQTARDLGLHVLVETHDALEMECALRLNCELIGVNNRALHTFNVDLKTTEKLAKLIPPTAALVAESGIFTRSDVERMAQSGASAVLVGESIVKSGDIGTQITTLSTVPRVDRSH